MSHTGALYDDRGTDYLSRSDPERLKRHATTQLQLLGYDVVLTPRRSNSPKRVSAWQGDLRVRRAVNRPIDHVVSQEEDQRKQLEQ